MYKLLMCFTSTHFFSLDFFREHNNSKNNNNHFHVLNRSFAFIISLFKRGTHKLTTSFLRFNKCDGKVFHTKLGRADNKLKEKGMEC